MKITTGCRCGLHKRGKGVSIMANRVFQSVIYQMKDAINRVVGVVLVVLGVVILAMQYLG